MAIDPAIPLAVQMPHLDTPIESQSKALGLRSMQNTLAAQQQEATLRAQAVQENTMKLATAKRTQAGIDAQSAAIQASIETDDETGEKIVNHKKVSSTLEQAGFPELADSYLQHADAVSTSEQSLIQKRAALRQASADLVGEHALSLQTMARDPKVSDADLQAALITHAGQAAGSGLLTEEQARGFLAKAQSAPSREALASQLESFVTPNARQRAATLQKTIGECKKAEAEAALATAKATPPSAAKYQAQIDAAIPETDKGNAPLRTRTMSAVQNARTVEDADKAIDEMRKQLGQIDVARQTVPFKVEVGVQTAKQKNKMGELSDAAAEQLATQYAQSGVMPALGMGSPIIRTQIFNKVAELFPGTSLAQNRAVFDSNKQSLTNMQKTVDTLSAFENTAGKNLDQFLALAKKVPDTGSPWINKPLREVDEKALGSTDVAAFEAARDVALREVARVTNDPKLSGALTDSARAEVSGLSPESATFAQIKRVVDVLKQDMKNVHDSATDQVADITKRFPGIGKAAAAVTITSPKGKTYTFDSQAKADAFVKAAKEQKLWE